MSVRSPWMLPGHALAALLMAAAGAAWTGHEALAAPSGSGYTRSSGHYLVPEVELLDTDRASVPLARVLSGDNPVMLNFIFTGCGSVCPAMSASFARVQAELGRERRDLLLVSISVDPEQDSPLALRNYARHYGAGPRWKLLTGGGSTAVQRAFGAYPSGDKADFVPVTLIRAGANKPWLRLEGAASAADLMREYRLLAAR